MKGRVLVKGGTVLSLDRGVGNTVGADVLIEDGVISEVGPSLRARNADVVDAADCIVMPGFVDAHRHVWRSITRNLDAARPRPTCPPTSPPMTSTPRRWSGCCKPSKPVSPPSSTGATSRSTPLTTRPPRRPTPTPASERCWSPRLRREHCVRRRHLRVGLARRRRSGPGFDRCAVGRRQRTTDPRPRRYRRGVRWRDRRARPPRSAGASRHVVPLHPPERRRLRCDRCVLDRGGTHPGE